MEASAIEGLDCHHLISNPQLYGACQRFGDKTALRGILCGGIKRRQRKDPQCTGGVADPRFAPETWRLNSVHDACLDKPAEPISTNVCSHFLVMRSQSNFRL